MKLSFFLSFLLLCSSYLTGSIAEHSINSIERSKLEKENAVLKSNYHIDIDVLDASYLISNSIKAQDVFHLVSHGKPGQLKINGTWLNAVEIVRLLKPRLNENHKNLLIYGCSFAKGIAGLKAVQYIEESLKIKVFASTNVTGANGDWFFEHGGLKLSNTLKNYPYSLQEVCGNGIDDDNDGLIDQFDPDCTDDPNCAIPAPTQPPSNFIPSIETTYSPAGVNFSSYQPPMFADTDGDGEVEVVVLAFNTNEIHVFNPVTGATEATIPAPNTGDKDGGLALGDVDNDGFVDIFAYVSSTEIARFEFNGTAYVEQWRTVAHAGGRRKHLNILDLNRDGIPEIIPAPGYNPGVTRTSMINAVTGAAYPGDLPGLSSNAKGLYAFTADADLGNNGNEGDVEIIRGTQVYRYDFVAGTYNLIREVGAPYSNLQYWTVFSNTSIADMDGDGDVDAVVIANADAPDDPNGVGRIMVWIYRQQISLQVHLHLIDLVVAVLPLIILITIQNQKLPLQQIVTFLLLMIL